MKKGMEKQSWKKTVIAACACATFVTGAVYASSQPLSNILKDKNMNNLAAEVKNTFTLSARAEAAGTKVLKKGKEIPIFTSTDDNGLLGSSWSSCGPDDTDEKTHKKSHEIAYCHDVSLICEGENIDTITYSINTGYLIPPQPETSDESHNTSYTVAADNQTDETTTFSIAGKSVLTDADYHLLFGYNTKESIDDRQANIDRTLLEMTGVENKVLNEIIITAEIKYKDGSTQEAKIQPGAACRTYQEIGMTGSDAKGAATLVKVTTYKLL